MGRAVAHDVAALSTFEVFLFAGVATVLITRAFLAVAGYPQVGGHGLHVAHVLYGGLFMAIAMTMFIIGVGSRVRLRAALLGGVGFGLFIDEVGKFVTKNVNYFFRPAAAIIYAVFMLFCLVVREILQRRRLTDERRISLAAMAVADQALGELDEVNRKLALRLIENVRHQDDVARAVRAALLARHVTASKFELRLSRLRDRVAAFFAALFAKRWAIRVIFGVLVLEIIATLGTAVFDLLDDNFGSHPVPHTANEFGELASSIASALIMAAGIVLLVSRRRQRGLHVLQLGILIDLLFTVMFQFLTLEFAALEGFAIQLVALIGVRFQLHLDELAADARIPAAGPPPPLAGPDSHPLAPVPTGPPQRADPGCMPR